MMKEFSDFMVYVDESGDHNLFSIDNNFPVFVLAFCIFHKNHYMNTVMPKIQKLKFEYFGYDFVILHEREILKGLGDFKILNNKEVKDRFLGDISAVMQDVNFVISACVIKKQKLKEKEKGLHPYHFALRNCLETLFEFVLEKHQENKTTFIAVESRGKKEDQELELEFHRICSGDNKFNKTLPFEIKIVSKAVNSTGLQFADLVARPIGRYVINPQQPNRVMDILKDKFFCEGGRKNVGTGFDQKGLKHFP